MNLHNKILTLTMATLAICLVSACTGAPASPKQTSTPGLSEGDIRTQAVGTALAVITASAPLPTRTATVTPLPSATATQTAIPTVSTPVPPLATLPVIARPTVTFTPSQTDFVCEIIKQNPGPEGEPIESGAPFDATVTLKNTGDNDWHFGKVLFMYTNGKNMQTNSGVILVKDTEKGHEAHLTVDMDAPDSPGTYTTGYSLIIGQLFFCPVHFTITVK